MSAPAVVHASESGHWYDRDGNPMYDVPAKSGQPRAATLRDARTMFLVPGVSTIIRCAAAPGLENWKVDQGILAALTLPRLDTEAEAEWLYRVKQDSQEQGRAAAARGTEIHAEIERYYAGLERGFEVAAGVYARPPVSTVYEAVGLAFGVNVDWRTELAFAHPLGFGGKADLLGFEYIDGPDEQPSPTVLIDFKTKDNWPDGKLPATYDEHFMQLAAYRYGLGAFQAKCAIVFVSRAEPWQVSIATLDDAELDRGWRCFNALLDYWKAKSNYDPSWQEQADDIPF